MLFHFVLSLFLYFPEDKSEYWGAGFTFLIFLIGAILTMKFIIHTSKKEAEKTKELEEKLLKQVRQESEFERKS